MFWFLMAAVAVAAFQSWKGWAPAGWSFAEEVAW